MCSTKANNTFAQQLVNTARVSSNMENLQYVSCLVKKKSRYGKCTEKASITSEQKSTKELARLFNLSLPTNTFIDRTDTTH